MSMKKYNTEVSLLGEILSNPVIPASGCFAFGEEYSELYDLNILGSIALKGTTKDERFGNPTPRIAEASSGVLNSIGLQNPGYEKVISEELPKLRKLFKKKFIPNICGFSEDEYLLLVEAFSKIPDALFLEINISCPNVRGGGLCFGTDSKSAYSLTKAIKAVSEKPIFMKLSPNVRDISEIALACEEGGADGISLVNTFSAMSIDLKNRRPLLANISGGLSGPAIFPIALRMVYEVYKAVKIPLIGIGGISSAEDVLKMLLAGATAVQIGAYNLKNPYACKEIIEELPKAMEKYGIDNLSDIIGGAHIGA